MSLAQNKGATIRAMRSPASDLRAEVAAAVDEYQIHGNPAHLVFIEFGGRFEGSTQRSIAAPSLKFDWPLKDHMLLW